LLELSELRWILLGIGAVAIAAIWWWTARRSRQAPGDAALREPMMPSSATPSVGEAAHSSERRGPEPRLEARLAAPPEPRVSTYGATRAVLEARSEPRESSPVPPGGARADSSSAAGEDADRRGQLAPLSIRAGDFDDVPALDQPMLIHADPIDFSLDSSRATGAPRFPSPPHDPDQEEADANATTVRTAGLQLPLEPPPADVPPPPVTSTPAAAPSTAPPPPVAVSPPPAAAASAAVAPTTARWRPASENSDRYSPTAPQAPNSSEKQKIVALRVCAVGDARWLGAALIGALEAHGLAYGRYQVFHRKHSDGRSIFCVASLVEPGTFDLSSMPDELFRGISLFAVLPGPIDPVQTIEAMLDTARELARDLAGTMQDAKGMPFSPQRAEALLKDVSRFQALLA
jgi:cell division protein ZipA